MNLRSITKATCIVCATYIIPLLYGWYMQNKNPQGILLYTPLADGTPPNYSPEFPISFFIGLIAISIFSAILALLGSTTAYLFRNSTFSLKAKSLSKNALISLVASLTGLIACVMLP